MEEKIFNAIIANTYTARNLQKRLRVLKLLHLKKLFGMSEQFGEQSEIEEEQEWLSTLSEEDLKVITKDNVYQIFANLEERIKKIELLTIYVAIDLPKGEIERIAAKIRQDYGNSFLFDIKFDPNIIAGASLVWKGIYRDYSVRSMISVKKDNILTEFRRFVGRSQ